MKWTSTFLIATLFIFIMACSNDKTPPSAPQQVIPPTNQPAPPINTNASSNLPTVTSTSADGTYHYICPNGDPGGSANQGACATCGAALTHNQAFHNNPANNTPATNPITTQTTPPPSPAQNAAGQFHYTCPNGHPGAGTAGACASCGATLAHNQAFHDGGTANPTITTSPTTPGSPVSPIIQTQPQSQPQINVPSSPGTATNSKGVYHYVCPSGHAGGSGAAGACASCGAALVHNQAYHN